MANTHDCGRLYVTRTARITGGLLQRGWTSEIEEPWRQGRCLVLRIPFTEIGYGIGLWGRQGQEQKSLDRMGVQWLPWMNGDFWEDEDAAA